MGNARILNYLNICNSFADIYFIFHPSLGENFLKFFSDINFVVSLFGTLLALLLLLLAMGQTEQILMQL